MIGSRTLIVALQQGEREVIVKVFQPEGHAKDWSCKFEIGWPEGATRHFARGVDALQAANLAQKMIGAEIYTSDHHTQGRLRWEKAGGGYGFPVPNNIRNLLVGEDRNFEG